MKFFEWLFNLGRSHTVVPVLQLPRQRDYQLRSLNDCMHHLLNEGETIGCERDPLKRIALRDAAVRELYAVFNRVESHRKECEALLQSARAIAERKGEHTAWKRFADSIAVLGISGNTPRVYKLHPSEMAASEREIIRLTPAEIQSGMSRVCWAEGLIRQLPETHDGRNSWLLNYGRKP